MDIIELTIAGGAATITLNRPDALNAFDDALSAGLRDAVATVAADDAVRAVVIRGAGRGFSSGADLREMAGRAHETGRAPEVESLLRERYHPIITGIREMAKPVIAAVNGPAVGIGCSLALACDLVVAAESAYFLLAFVNIGLVPDGGSSLFVPSRAGMARAFEMAMLGERVPAAQALEWGLVNRVVADDALDGEVAGLAERLAKGPTRSYAGIKRQLNTWLYSRMDEQLELEAAIQQEAAETGDFAEGVAAFAAKRPAEFRGA